MAFCKAKGSPSVEAISKKLAAQVAPLFGERPFSPPPPPPPPPPRARCRMKQQAPFS